MKEKILQYNKQTNKCEIIFWSLSFAFLTLEVLYERNCSTKGAAQGSRKVFNKWSKSHFGTLEVWWRTFPRSGKCPPMLLKKKLRKLRNLPSPSELNEILCLLENVSDEIHVLKNFINEIQTAYLSMSKPKTWLAA